MYILLLYVHVYVNDICMIMNPKAQQHVHHFGIEDSTEEQRRIDVYVRMYVLDSVDFIGSSV